MPFLGSQSTRMCFLGADGAADGEAPPEDRRAVQEGRNARNGLRETPLARDPRLLFPPLHLSDHLHNARQRAVERAVNARPRRTIPVDRLVGASRADGVSDGADVVVHVVAPDGGDDVDDEGGVPPERAFVGGIDTALTAAVAVEAPGADLCADRLRVRDEIHIETGR